MMDNHLIKEWALKHSIEKKTIELCKKAILNYEREEPDEFNSTFRKVMIDDAEYNVVRLSLNFSNSPEYLLKNISMVLNVYYGEKFILRYEALYSIDGEPEDDFFEPF